MPARDGALTVISAISPPGGDFSEPVTQAALRVVGALWALDPSLAHQRQFPAVDWETSYSLYAEAIAPWFAEHGGPDWSELRRATLELLQRERELREIAELVGPEALQDADRLLLEVARIVRETVLGQSAYDPNDALSALGRRTGSRRWRSACIAGRARAGAGRAFEQLDLGSLRRLLAALRRPRRQTCRPARPRRKPRWRPRHMSGPVRATTAPPASPARCSTCGARRAALGEWVEIRAPGQAPRRGQVIDAGREITVIQVLEDTIGLPPARAEVTLTGKGDGRRGPGTARPRVQRHRPADRRAPRAGRRRGRARSGARR